MTRERRKRVFEVLAHIERAGRVLLVIAVDLLRMACRAFHTLTGHEVRPRLVAIERQQRVIQIEKREIAAHAEILVMRG